MRLLRRLLEGVFRCLLCPIRNHRSHVTSLESQDIAQDHHLRRFGATSNILFLQWVWNHWHNSMVWSVIRSHKIYIACNEGRKYTDINGYNGPYSLNCKSNSQCRVWRCADSSSCRTFPSRKRQVRCFNVYTITCRHTSFIKFIFLHLCFIVILDITLNTHYIS